MQKNTKATSNNWLDNKKSKKFQQVFFIKNIILLSNFSSQLQNQRCFTQRSDW